MKRKRPPTAKERTGRLPFLDMTPNGSIGQLVPYEPNGEHYALVGLPFGSKVAHLVMAETWLDTFERGRPRALCGEIRDQSVADAWVLLPLSRGICQTCRALGAHGEITKHR